MSAPEAANGRVVSQGIDVDDFRMAEFTDRILRHQPANIGIAAAASAQEGRAPGKVVQVLFRKHEFTMHGLLGFRLVAAEK